MDDKKKPVDYPEYDPHIVRLPFPPKEGDYEKAERGVKLPGQGDKPKREKPYHETYDPDPASPDPSQTAPGEPDIRDPKVKMPSEEDLKKFSPDIDLKE